MSAAYDFQDAMAIGKQAAMDRRNRGLPVGKPAPGWTAKPRQIEDTPENRLAADLDYYRRELADAQNTIAVMRQNGGADDVGAIDDFGAEFDRLCSGARLAGPAPATVDHAQARKDARGPTMTNKQYLDALKKLGLTPAGKPTAKALGLSIRQIQRIKAGQDVPETVAKLLRMYLKHGLPAE